MFMRVCGIVMPPGELYLQIGKKATLTGFELELRRFTPLLSPAFQVNTGKITIFYRKIFVRYFVFAAQILRLFYFW